MHHAAGMRIARARGQRCLPAALQRLQLSTIDTGDSCVLSADQLEDYLRLLVGQMPALQELQASAAPRHHTCMRPCGCAECAFLLLDARAVCSPGVRAGLASLGPHMYRRATGWMDGCPGAYRCTSPQLTWSGPCCEDEAAPPPLPPTHAWPCVVWCGLHRLQPSFLQHYKKIAVRKILFFHGRNGSVRVRDLAVSSVMGELMELKTAPDPASGDTALMANWFSLQVRVWVGGLGGARHWQAETWGLSAWRGTRTLINVCVLGGGGGGGRPLATRVHSQPWVRTHIMKPLGAASVP